MASSATVPGRVRSGTRQPVTPRHAGVSGRHVRGYRTTVDDDEERCTMTGLTLRLVTAGLLAGLCSPAGAMGLCTGRTGTGSLKVRANCTSDEMQVAPVGLRFPGPPGDS